MANVDFSSHRHRVTLERRSTDSNAWGQTSDAWAELATVWARVSTIGGREAAGPGQTTAQATARVELRAGSAGDLTAADRVRFNGRVLKILAAYDPEERGRVFVLDCVEWKGASDA